MSLRPRSMGEVTANRRDIVLCGTIPLPINLTIKKCHCEEWNRV